MLGMREHLVRDAPDAPPGVVDIVADPPGGSNLFGPKYQVI